MSIFANSPLGGSRQEVWFMRFIRLKETDKIKEMREAQRLEIEISAKIAQEVRAQWEKDRGARRLEVIFSKELQGLLRKQAEVLRYAADNARAEASYEKGFYGVVSQTT